MAEEYDFARGPAQRQPVSDARAEWEELHTLALTIGCRDCHQPIDTSCVDVDTGRPLTKFPAHTHRINDARKAQ